MIPSLDISSLATSYESGTLTPEAVLKEVYRRIRERGERPVWIHLEPEEKALARLAHAPRGPLWGIPFAVKDNIDVAGVPTTCACPGFAYTPERSATVIEKLEAAGAIVIGKTNLDQFATGLNGTRSPYGAPTSVFSDKHISGGSSSGSAVAVAAGLVSFALGTDTAGSGRVPAAFNNIVGLKPTKGLLSTRGLVPACRSLDVISIFALTAADTAAVASAAAGFDSEDDYSRCPPRAFAPTAPPATLRLGVPKEGLEFYGDREAAHLFAEAVSRAKSLGAEIVPIDLRPFLETASLLYSGPWVAERLAAVKEFAEKSPDAIIEPVRSIILGARTHTAVATFEGLYKLARLARKTAPVWQSVDVLMVPTAPTTYTIAELQADPVTLNSNLGHYTNFVNLLDLAAIALPAGFGSTGLPFGVTLIGQAFSDDMLATLGDVLHRRLAGATLGATGVPLDVAPPIVGRPAEPSTIRVAVVGAHLKGEPLNWQLTDRGARLIETTQTAKGYRLVALPGTTPPKPGLIYDGESQGNIEIEVWEMDIARFGSFMLLVPPPLGIGTIKLSDDRLVKGFLVESHATQDAEDISHFGGWRAFIHRAS